MIEKLKRDKDIISSTELCIPEELIEAFLEEFFNKFPKVRKTNKDQTENAPPKGSILTHVNIFLF